MDTKRWKSIIVPRDVYDEVVAVAYIEGRTIGGQLRMTFDYWKRQNLTKNDLNVLADTVKKNRKAEEDEEKAAVAALVQNELNEAVKKT